ncbi:MAG: aspartate--tRNA ligase [Bacilli bacterium]|nr:aspartate--tRNA ligase [Bacilli bacterium]
MERTHNNGTLSLKNVGEKVVLLGWVSKRRNLGSICFIDLRDRSGIVQINVDPSKINIEKVRTEYVLQVKGTVVKKDVPNKNLITGDIEVVADDVIIVNSAETTPIIIADDTDALEDTRLKYRYLDLRRPCMQKILMNRAKIVSAVHEYLDAHDFVEVETPMLGLSSPEGAREYLVPSRLHAGHFYALPQSPQIYKQLLMIGGMERYYQIARCFRDEDLRADRQPDFTQIDIETSFLDQDEFLELMEGCLASIFKKVRNIDLQLPLRRMNYDDALDFYGSDKPDTRFDIKIQDVKSVFANTSFEGFKVPYVRAIVVPGVASSTSRKKIDELVVLAKKHGLKGLTTIKMINGALESSFLKFMSETEQGELIKTLSLKDEDLVIIAASTSRRYCCFGLGAIRSQYGHELGLVKPNTYDLLWIVKFPMFTKDDETGELVAEHHPFTRPIDEDLKYLDEDPTKVYAYAYDIVINGYEAGGGTLRIYDSDVQKKIFEILGLSDEDIRRKFGWFVDALKYGTPPHGGLAFGLDRLAMILNETNNIKDVIAFPKNLSGVCPMTQAPGMVSDDQLKDLFLEITKLEEN